MLDRLIRETDAIARLTGDVLLLVDTAGIILHATPGAATLFGRGPAQLTGLPFGIVVTGPDGTEVTLAETGKHARLRQEGLEGAGLPLTRVLLHDITACRRIEDELHQAQEAAKAADKAKSHFLANITHEIRTPMIGVLGMTELTLGTPLTSKQREYLEMARHSAQSLLTVLNDIVDYARIEIGALELAHIPFKLDETVEDIINIFRPLAAKKGLNLTWRRASTVPTALLGDPSRLRQILINLVGNAVKFTDTGSVVPDITADEPATAEATAAPRCQLSFTVRDTGIGIPQDKIRAIFDSFTQADVSPARRFQGAGLGLAIVRHLVALMGGSHHVESQEGHGSVFSFRVPFERPEPRPDPANAPKPAGPTGPRSLAVLLAEDNPINQIYVQELLEMEGHRVVVAHTGRRALEALRRQPFDVILMDIQMPEMDGLEATRVIRADQSGDFDPAIPIVALTAHALKGDRETFLRAGMTEYVSKPVSPDDLTAALARAMGEADRNGAPAAATCSDPAEVLDWNELLTKARGNTGFLMKLFSAFVEEQPGHMEGMREALTLADCEHLAFMAHSLKGAAATMCAPRLREACLDVERAAKACHLDEAAAAFRSLEGAMADVLVIMRAKLTAQREQSA